MARLLDDAQNEYLDIESAVVSAAPFAWGCWFYSDNATASQHLMSIQDKDVTSHNWRLLLRGDIGGDPLQHAAQGTNFEAAESASGYSVNTWHHAIGIEVSPTSRVVLLNGGSRGTNVVNLTPLNADRTTVGRAGDSSPDGYMSGRIAWPAVWNLSVWPGATDADKAANFEARAVPGLAAGYSPLFWPLGLMAFWPLGGLDTEETDGGTARDIWGGFDLTANSDAVGPGIEDHPGGLVYPTSPQLVIPAAPAAGGLSNILGGGIVV